MTKILCCTCDEHCPFHGDKAHRAAENAAVLLEALEVISEAIDAYGGDLHNKLEGVQEAREAIAKATGGD